MRKDLIKKEITEKIKEKEKEIQSSLEHMISQVSEETSLEYIDIMKSLIDSVITEDITVKHIEIWGKSLGKENFLGDELKRKLLEQPVNRGENLNKHIDRILSYMQEEWNKSGYMFEEHFKNKYYKTLFPRTVSFNNDGTNPCSASSSITLTEIFSVIINVTSAPLSGKGKNELIQNILSLCAGLIIPVLEATGMSITVDLLGSHVAFGIPSIATSSHIIKDSSLCKEKVKKVKEKSKEIFQNNRKNFKENIQYNLEKAFFQVNTAIAKEIIASLFFKQNYLLLPFQPVFSKN